MRSILRTILKRYLWFWAKAALILHKPAVIAVAGTTNKTFVKDAVTRILKDKGLDVRPNANGFNTEFGLPLSILSLPSGYNEMRAWLPAISQAPKMALGVDFPKYLVLEFGVSQPGDMEYLLSIVKPKISILTNLTQRYLESFDDIDSFAKEFKILIEKTDSRGAVIINNDVARLAALKSLSAAPVATFGFSSGSDFQAVLENEENRNEFSVRSPNRHFEACMTRPGIHHIYAHLASLAVDNFLKNEESKNAQAEG
jgi:UDP-N-acetylmuramoyl-tripeptide--D-alanyl-D-alanine ligase